MSATRSAARQQDWPDHIRARYGLGQRRWLPWAIAAAGLGFMLLILGLGWRVANPPVRAAVLSYTPISDQVMEIRYQVVRGDPVAVTCVLRARAKDGFDVGYAVVQLPADSGSHDYSYPLGTAYRGLVGEVLGCAAGTIPPGVAGSQFRPGVLPPEQP